MSTATVAPTATVHRIPAWRYEELTLKIARMARKAVKLGCTPPTATIVETVEVETVDDETGITYVNRFHMVEVTGESPHLAGHRMVAVIDRDLTEPDAPNVVFALGDVEIDGAWRTVGDTCEHDACNGAKRGRKKLVVVRDEAGVDRLVGSTCVADYLGGVDPSTVAAALTYVEGMAAMSDYDDDVDSDEDPRSHGEVRYPLDDLLSVTFAIIRECGWVSKGAAWDTNKTATADHVERALCGADTNVDCTPEDIENAAAAAAWAYNLTPAGDDYLTNLNAVAHKTTVAPKMVGLACSMAASWARAAAAEARKAAATVTTSEHFGAVGARMVVTAKVVGRWTVETNYGMSTWITAVTPAGNIVKWKASGRAPKEGATITGKATVKAHGDWKDVKETVVTRWAWEAIETTD